MRHADPFAWISILRDVILFLASAAAGIWAWFRTRHAYSWPSTQGTIWEARARQSEGRSHVKPWNAEITYSYTVDGEYYSGVQRIETFTERGAERLVDGWKGRMVVVRYSPSKHDISVLFRSDQVGGQLGN